MRRRINVAATPTGDSRGEVELNSVELTTQRRENRALNTAEHGSQAHLKMRFAEKSLQWRSMHLFSRGDKMCFAIAS